MKRLLITGASGFLGWNLCLQARRSWDVVGVYLSRALSHPGVTLLKADLTDYRTLKTLFRDIRPDALIHAAAAAGAEHCQTHPAQTERINVDASVNLAGLCSETGIPCVFTSTDLVFDGLHPPYREGDPPAPVSVYGEQKVSAETGMRASYPGVTVCRLPLLFGDPGPVARSFLQPLIAAMESGRVVNLFIDEFRTPLSGRDAAAGLLQALEGGPGLLHLGGAERISRYHFGLLAAEVFCSRRPFVRPCRLGELNLAAPRPPDVSLDNSKARSMGFSPHAIREELAFLKRGSGG